MPKRYIPIGIIYFIFAFSLIATPITSNAKNYELKRVVSPKPVYQVISEKLNSSQIVLNLKKVSISLS